MTALFARIDADLTYALILGALALVVIAWCWWLDRQVKP